MKRIACIVLMFLANIYITSAYVVRGNVSEAESGDPIPGASIMVPGTRVGAVANSGGDFEIDVPDDATSLRVHAIGRAGKTIEISKNIPNLEIQLSEQAINLDDVYVYAASRRTEKITESPSAIVRLDPGEIVRKSRSGRLPDVFNGALGIDILRSGATDFIVNSRGFNGGLNRRVLVVQDGRDVAMPLLGAQEWNSFSMPIEEYASVEFVRGPATALYGPNAFNGVLNLRSYAPEDVRGTRLAFMAGEFDTYRGDLRHAGVYGDFSYKITAGMNRSLNHAYRRDSVQFLEYPGLALERRQLTEADRETFSTYGALRMDYKLDINKGLTAEIGASRSGNETYVFGLGRTLVKDVVRPYLRLGYNSENINVHAHYMQRSVLDTMWLLVPNAPLLDDSRDMLIDFQHNFSPAEDMHIIWGVTQQLQQIRTSGTSIPFDVNADFTGVYSQYEWRFMPELKFVATGRFDYASIHESQFSPRVALVASPRADHKFRLSFGRAFQRPNYSELYRLTPDAPAFSAGGRPVNFAAVQQSIADSIRSLGSDPGNLDLGLSAFRAVAFGNEDLKVEKIQGLEFGYTGVFDQKLLINFDVYYNRLNDFVTNFLPGVNPAIEKWYPGLEGDLAQYNNLVYNMVMSNLSVRDQQRLAIFNGAPAFVVSNTNVGEVDEYGLEIGAEYHLNSEFKIDANYSYFGFDIISAQANAPLLPNTSPHRANANLTYQHGRDFDVTLGLRYTAGFDWLAGTYTGYVPEYTIVNLSAGARIFDGLRAGLNIFNLLDRKFFQIFGGTYLPRYATLRLSYEFD